MKLSAVFIFLSIVLLGCVGKPVRQPLVVVTNSEDPARFSVPSDLVGKGDQSVVGVLGVTNTSVFRSDTLWNVASRILTTNLVNMNFFRVRDWEKTKSLYDESDIRSSGIAITPDGLRKVQSDLDCDYLIGGAVTYYDVTQESEVSAVSKNKEITTTLRVDLWLQNSRTGEYVGAASGNGQSVQKYSGGLLGGYQGAWTQNAAHRALEVAMNQALVKILRQYRDRPEKIAREEGAVGSKSQHVVPRIDFSTLRDRERQADTWALVVGVDNFSDSKIAPLKYAQRDALRVYDFLVHSSDITFCKEQVFLLTGQDATSFNIKSVLDFISKSAEQNDKVLLYFSTHGIPDSSLNKDVRYIATSDTRLNSLYKTSIGFEEIDDAVNNRMMSNSVLVMADACFSADVLRGSELYTMGGKGLVIRGADDALPEGFKGQRVALEDSGVSSDIVDKFRGLDGRAFLASSGRDERSWESDRLQHGYFTHYLLKSLSENGFRSVSAIFDDLESQVPRVVAEEIGKSQHPVLGMKRDMCFVGR